MATNFMNLDLPTVTVELGPEWANKLNTALESVDEHDHSSGKGAPIPTSALNINADLDFNDQKIYDLLSTQYSDQTATLTGASNALSIYSVSGNLYFTNLSGTAVQLTDGNSITASPAAVQSFEIQSVSANLTILPASTPTYFLVDTSASRTITLPLAANVTSGRVYFIKDISGQSHANPITLDIQGSDTVDGGSSVTLNSDYGAWMAIGDGVGNWYIS